MRARPISSRRSPPLAAVRTPPSDPRLRYAVIGVCIVVVLVYASLLTAPSLIWDDDLNIFDNAYFVSGPWWALWIKPYFGMYIPLTSTIWAALFHLGHGAVWPFRLLNVALHVINVLLFAKLLGGFLRRCRIESSIAVVVGVAV